MKKLKFLGKLKKKRFFFWGGGVKGVGSGGGGPVRVGGDWFGGSGWM